MVGASPHARREPTKQTPSVIRATHHVSNAMDRVAPAAHSVTSPANSLISSTGLARYVWAFGCSMALSRPSTTAKRMRTHASTRQRASMLMAASCAAVQTASLAMASYVQTWTNVLPTPAMTKLRATTPRRVILVSVPRMVILGTVSCAAMRTNALVARMIVNLTWVFAPTSLAAIHAHAHRDTVETALTIVQT